MKFSGFSIAITMIISMSLIWISDMPLNDMLGEHPLQSELTFVEGHVKKVEQEGELQGEDVAVEPMGETEQLVLITLFLMAVSGGLTFFIYRSLYFIRHQKKKPSDGLGIAKLGWMMGLGFLILGAYYATQGSAGIKELSKPVAELEMRRKQGFVFSPEEKRGHGILMDIHNGDQGRLLLGKMALGLGLLIFLSGFGVAAWEKKRSVTVP